MWRKILTQNNVLLLPTNAIDYTCVYNKHQNTKYTIIYNTPLPTYLRRYLVVEMSCVHAKDDSSIGTRNTPPFRTQVFISAVIQLVSSLCSWFLSLCVFLLHVYVSFSFCRVCVRLPAFILSMVNSDV